MATASTLTAKQKSVAVTMQKLRASGDSNGTSFFANIKEQNPALFAAFEEFLNGGNDVVGGIKRSDLDVDTSKLTGKQFKMAVAMAMSAKEGGEAGVRFFNSIQPSADQGIQQSQTYLKVRDAIAKLTPEDLADKQKAAQAARVPGQKPAPAATAPTAPTAPTPVQRPTPAFTGKRKPFSNAALY